jgi:hypothetical protein
MFSILQFTIFCYIINLDSRITRLEKNNTVVVYNGQQFVIFGLVGEGRTYINRVPVYHAVFVPEKRANEAI